MILTESQHNAVESKEAPILIVAGAGTGKTMAIAHCIAYLIRNKIARPDEILALTFTEKAAAEMSERVDVPCLPICPAGTVHFQEFVRLQRSKKMIFLRMKI
jgi:superfamily I DNA/RNA helicase